ncbi:MAG: sulfite exporter TauE/SafE family protein [Deltaproteobacteria bacterium]|nr:sulfite exporter TauE/SafE family protein [Deltaproteobacteria bacterium]
MDATLAPTLALMILVGFALGIFGGGGSILAVPVLVYVAHLTPSTAIGMSLAIVGTTSLVGSYAHHRRGQVDHRVALLFGGAGVATAYVGARLTPLASGRALMLTFAVMLMVVGAWMLLGQRRATAAGNTERPSSPRLAHALIAGAAVGAVSGFLGVGGGFLAVPALIAFTGLDMRKAVGTSLLVIAINSAAGFLGHLSGDRLDFELVAMLTAAAILGAIVGARVARRVSVLKLRVGFALFVIAVGIGVAAQ